MVRSSLEDQEDKESENDEKFIMIVMNQAWKELITKIGLPSVPSAQKLGTFYELVCENHDFMVNGNAEGLIVVNPSFGSSV